MATPASSSSPILSEKPVTHTPASSKLGDEERGSSTDRLRSQTDPSPQHAPVPNSAHTVGAYQQATDAAQEFWDRFRGKGRRKVGWAESLKNILLSSWLNVLLIVIPIAWVSHWMFLSHKWGPEPTFVLNFLAIIPLEGIFDWGGEQMALYLGKDLGDLLVVTLNNAVEAVLAIVLLTKCDLRLLQATIVGVVILHLLLIPGVSFLVGGSQIQHQALHPHHTDLNHSLLMIGFVLSTFASSRADLIASVLATLLPTAFFAALDRGATQTTSSGAEAVSAIVTDATRDQILRMSRGIAIMLLVIYIASRFYLHNPPGEGNALTVLHDAPQALKHEEAHLKEEEALTNPWACLILLAFTIAIMAATAEFLVESIEGVRETSDIQEEWFGLILLPIVSFSADGAVAIVFFLESLYDHFTGRERLVPSMLARGRAIDLSIQFTLWWMPFLVLLGWWIGKPMHLLFDYFEVALLLGACFLVNYVTADAKTNWVEGLILVSFYLMIALTTWFYPGQPEVELMLVCFETVAEAIAGGGEGAAEGAVAGGTEVVAENATELISRAVSHFL
ncbi:uncharacterized protein BXZ73DRAFT_106748 [Epithele typhae]|uniref:uncharacterized protein n=1 Tax=Epithele typhae TaxID=378194 RepID=UPI002008897D|nr:uncharacterized protein BXZ73DRAFT_106748 [Epithele typhae]KAH9913962.1 hypothetical protein BXZ73DRAFT_106748 [Epithele typhae]